jgi:hypothetical protein
MESKLELDLGIGGAGRTATQKERTIQKRKADFDLTPFYAAITTDVTVEKRTRRDCPYLG